MEVKSMARVKYSYNIEGVNLSGLTQSNIVTTEIRKMSLSVKKLVNTDFYKPQDIITYTIILSNTGNVAITNIVLKDDVKHQNFIMDSLSSFNLNNELNYFNYELKKNTLVINIEEIKAQEVIIITYKTIICDNIDHITPQLKVACDELKDIKEQTIELKQGYAEIECFKKVSNDYTYLNTNLSYELSLINKGNCSAYNVEVYDELPQTYELNADNGVTINNNPVTFKYENNILSFIIPEIPTLAEVNVLVNGKIIK